MRPLPPIWNSIRWRILIYYTLLITVTVSLLVTAYVIGARRMEEDAIRSRLQTFSIRLLPIVFPPPRRPFATGSGSAAGGSRADVAPIPFGEYGRHPEWEKTLADLRAQEFFLKVVNNQGDPVYVSADDIPDELGRTRTDARLRQFVSFRVKHTRGICIVHRKGTLFVGLREGPVPRAVRRALLHSVPVGLLVIVVCSLVGHRIIRTSLRPIDDMNSAAQKILDGNLAQRFTAGEQRSELEQLARLLNQAFHRLQGAYDRQVRFTADASHELRTPVAAILADCQFSLNKPRGTKRYLETIEVCHEAAQHMRMLLDQLGLLAAFDHDEPPLEKERVELRELCELAMNVARPLARQAGIELREELAPGIEVMADPLRLSQALINLLKNAVQYNRPGGDVTLRVRAEGPDALIEVEDAGVGIPAENLETIFERFARLDKSRSTEHHNFGLGLAVTRSIVRAHEGRITVSSVVGRGSTFRITLPLVAG